MPRAFLAASLTALALGAPFALVGACGGSTSSDGPSDGGEGGTVVPEAAIDAGPDGHTPIVPRCTTPRAATPDAGGALIDPQPLDDGGPSFFSVHPLPQLANNGGPILANPRIVPVFFKDDDMANDLEDFVASMGCTDYWRSAVGEYGVGDALAAPAVHLPDAAPTKITDTQIESMLSKMITAGTLEAPTKDSVYTLFFPETTTITEQGAESCQAFGGYHTDITVSGKHVAYAVIPRCDGFAGLSTMDALTGSTSHEIIEAATDPYNKEDPAFAYVDADHLAYVFVIGGEAGDLCAQEPDAFFQPDNYPFTVQRNWSNVQAHAGGNPCRPKGTSPFFTAAITLPDPVNLFGTGARGVNVPVGGSRVVDVDLYSEQPAATIEVQAFDASQALGANGSSSYSLDKNSGKSGDTLHLTITTPAGAPTDPEIFALYVRIGGRARLAFAGAVGH